MIRFARLLVLLPLLWVEGVWAVDCASTNYYLNSQAEVDALGATGCDRIEGDLVILQSSGITNLDGIANITSVEGGVEIVNSALTNIDGLSNLTSVGSLAVTENDVLTNLGGLASLTSVDEVLFIKYNPALTSLDGLSSLTRIGGALEISNNDALTTSMA